MKIRALSKGSFLIVLFSLLILSSVKGILPSLTFSLQTIYGEILPIHSNNDVAGLTRFLTDRLLGNPDIATTFAHPQVPGLYREGKQILSLGNHIYMPR